MEMSTNTSILSSVLCRAFTLLLRVLGLRFVSLESLYMWFTCVMEMTQEWRVEQGRQV